MRVLWFFRLYSVVGSYLCPNILILKKKTHTSLKRAQTEYNFNFQGTQESIIDCIQVYKANFMEICKFDKNGQNPGWKRLRGTQNSGTSLFPRSLVMKPDCLQRYLMLSCLYEIFCIFLMKR